MPGRRSDTPARAGSLDVRVRGRGKTRVRLDLRGDCDYQSADLFSAVVADQLRAGRRTIHVDMSAVTFLDAGGLRALIEARNDILGRHGQLVVIRPAGCVTRLLRITELDTVIPVVDAPRRLSSLGGDHHSSVLDCHGD